MYQLEEAVLTLAYLAVFVLIISKMSFFRVGSIPVQWFQGAFLLKVLSGFLLYLIYTYYYTVRNTADIWKYYDDGMVMFSALREHPIDYLQMLLGIGNDTAYFQPYYDRMNHWYRPYGSSIANDTHTIIRFNALVRLFSLGHYNVHSVVANFLGMVGLTGIFHFLRQMSPSKDKWFFAAVFLMPGMMFWASGVLKEPLLLFGLGMLLYSAQRLFENGARRQIFLLMSLSLVVLVTVKSYALVAIFPGLISWRLCKTFSRLHPAVVFTTIHAIMGLSVLLAAQFEVFDPFERLAQKQQEFYRLAEGGTYVQTVRGDTLYIYPEYHDVLLFSEDKKLVKPNVAVGANTWQNAKKLSEKRIILKQNEQLTVLLDYGKTGSTIDIPKLDASVISIMKAMPAALMNSLFRPFLWELRSPFIALSALENLVVVLVFVLLVLFFRSEALHHPMFYLAMFFSLIILVLIGLVTPVVGAIVRYKVPALPFLLCGLLALTDTERMETLFKKLFKKRVI